MPGTKPRYRYLGQWAARYHWVSARPVSPGDSRFEHVSCDVGAFWGGPPVIFGNCCEVMDVHDPHFWGRRWLFYCSGESGAG